MAFTKPLEIEQCKLGDSLVFYHDTETPFDFILNIYDLDDNLLHGPVSPDLEKNDKLFWFIDATSTFGIDTVKKYYKIIIEDPDLTGEDEETFILYVNDDANLNNYLDRILGLCGYNSRTVSYVWTRGQLTQFDIKIYETKAKLESAEAGTSDDFLAHYRITISYDKNYNPTTIQSVKQ